MPSKASSPSTTPASRKRQVRTAVAAAAAPAVDGAMDEEVDADGGGDAGGRLTQAERRALAERRILDAALELVARRGSVRMTLAEVGEAAGYSRGLPAHRFGSKTGLLQRVVLNIGARFEARRLALPQHRPGLDAVRSLVSTYFVRDDTRWIETRALLVMMTEGFMEDSELNPYIGEYIRSSISRLEQHIRDGIALGEIRADIDPTTAATLLLGALRGVLHQRLVLGDLSLDKVRDLALQMVDRTLAPH
ncbi:TetR/AcrR family transcriptional regulator [Pseudacidovorax sp. RU35E]|uniref:TetR/AcrR family transcriptional regulator n=1 Tax=Pseudacidovorax sp. RU35E TaxID=1907403 RepID=UPI0009558659|nr:TetR/AcrR family transcriptional regulator [Pseudacidovorax sp. RU35E]SIR61006.1 transcriptional regulator, TetR family [Pseudacidovorax sp. RU35E]